MTPNEGIEARLWDAANELRANSRLRASEYSTPVLGLVCLRYADLEQKTAAVFQHVYASYFGAGKSVYEAA